MGRVLADVLPETKWKISRNPHQNPLQIVTESLMKTINRYMNIPIFMDDRSIQHPFTSFHISMLCSYQFLSWFPGNHQASPGFCRSQGGSFPGLCVIPCQALGSCSETDIAVRVLMRVIGAYPKKNLLLVVPRCQVLSVNRLGRSVAI